MCLKSVGKGTTSDERGHFFSLKLPAGLMGSLSVRWMSLALHSDFCRRTDRVQGATCWDANAEVESKTGQIFMILLLLDGGSY